MLYVWAVLWGCPKSTTVAELEPEPEPVSPLAADAVRGIDTPVLRTLVADHWNSMMARYPQWANDLGDSRFAELLYDDSPEAQNAWLRKERDWVVKLAAFPDAVLTPRDRLTRDLLQRDLQSSLAAVVCQFSEWSLSARSNALVSANSMADNPRLDTAADAQALLARYRALPQSIRQQTANLKRGFAEGRVGIGASMKQVVSMLDEQIGLPADEWPMADALDAAPTFEGRAAWRDAVLATLDQDVRQAFVDYRDLIRDELMPSGRSGDRVGLHALPDGAACYEAQIQGHTTLARTADELHELGLAELKSIHAEFRTLGKTVLGTDELAAIFERLRTDEALRFKTSEEVQKTAEDALDRARAAMDKYFGRVPQAECVVQPVPDYLAPHTTIAYYQRPRPDGSRPGIYYVNVYAPETRPRFEAEVLAFHESIPGHHLQIAIAQEVDELPAFRRYGSFTAFIEGWALYTERLADEMELYSGDADRLGVLSFDAWRASRLVVDTGLHAKRWSREQAETFMAENTPLALNNIANEVDRYINTPGQALAYKVGQIEIAKLRDEARERLGEAFAYPEFHDQVLEAGALPLPVLADRIEQWLEQTASN
ncbi:MAG: DUF885 domain-containing protein [Myxococcota bacterium]